MMWLWQWAVLLELVASGRRTDDTWRRLTQRPFHSSTPRDAVWQPVADALSGFYVYSAFVESRTLPAVRVIAATKRPLAEQVLCRLWLPDNRTLTTKATVKIIKEHHNLTYSAAFVLCRLDGTGVRPQQAAGAALAVLARRATTRRATTRRATTRRATARWATTRPYSNLLLVQDTQPQHPNTDNIHVCVRPIDGNYGRVGWTIEWLEMNRLQGVDHFYIYNDSMSQKMSCIIKQYQKQGLVTILPWGLPLITWARGQLAAANDCLYRSMQTAHWTLPIDLDELLLPRREDSLQDLLTSLAARHSDQLSVIVFRNRFFFLDFQDDLPVGGRKSSLWTARKCRCCTRPHSVFKRSKYAVRAARAVELGIHHPWEIAQNTTSTLEVVPLDQGLLHHYRERRDHRRRRPISCSDGNGIGRVAVDRTARRWARQLLQRVLWMKTRLARTCSPLHNMSPFRVRYWPTSVH